MRTHVWTWNYTCVISNWESTEIKTKAISGSVFRSQILQNMEMNIVMHWQFWRKYGSVSNLFSCTGQICSWLQKVLISADWRTKVRSCAKKNFSAYALGHKICSNDISYVPMILAFLQRKILKVAKIQSVFSFLLHLPRKVELLY